MRPTRLLLSPDRTQFLRLDSVSLSCSSEDSGPWFVVRNTSRETRRRCEVWGEEFGSTCVLDGLSDKDSGVYWCERDKHRSEPVSITVTGTFNTTAPPAPSTFPTAPPPPPAPSPTPPSRASSSVLLVPLLSSGLVLVLLLLLLLLLLLWSKRCRRRQTRGVKDNACPEEGGAGDITYSDILHHQKRRPIRRTEREESPVYSSVKTEDICYSSIVINQSRGKGPGKRTNKEREESPVYSSVKTDDVCYSSVTINQSRDPAKRTKERTQQQKDSSTYAQIKVRTK